MIHFVALPLLVVLVTATVAGRALHRLAPAAAARWTALMLVAVIIAAVPTFWMLGMSGLAHFGVRSSLCDWSMHLLPSQPLVSGVIGAAALAMSIAGIARLARVIRTHLKVRCTDTCAFHLVDTPEVFAYTLPGPARTIAISRGLRESLEDNEYEIVLAHEQAHAHHRHDRYLLLALVATAVVPFMRSATDQLRFHLERWADEDAVQATGADRRLAACTIAKVALAGSRSPVLLGIASHGVAARADALIQPPPAVSAASRLHTMALVAVTIALSASQVHHTIEFTLHTMV
jgi:Zn-dependent protease with chaperone function